MTTRAFPSAKAAGPGEATRKTVSIVHRAAIILECFTPTTPSLSLVELSRRISLPKPTTFRIAAVLLRVGLLEQNPATGEYALGFTNLRFAEALLEGVQVRAFARPIMEELRDELNETIVLSVREIDYRYNVDSVESSHAVGHLQQLGEPIPLFAGAASRAILARMSATEVDDYFSRVTPTWISSKTITDAADLKRLIQQTRREGYARSDGEFTAGGYAIACPVDVPSGYRLSALHVSIPHARFSPSLEHRSIVRLKLAVRKISEAILKAGT